MKRDPSTPNAGLQEVWLDALLYGDLHNRAKDSLDAVSIAYRDEVIAALYGDIFGGRCTAGTKQQFSRWVTNRIAAHIRRIVPFDQAQQLKKKNGGKLTIADVRAIVFAYGPDTSTKPFPPYSIRDGVAEVRISKDVLRIPAVADSDDPSHNFLPILKMLWPFSIQNGRVVKSSSRESNRGTWRAHEKPLHEVFVTFTHPGIPFSMVKAKNGSFLDWTRGNLQPMGFGGKLGPAEHRYRIEQALKEASTTRGYDGNRVIEKVVPIDPALLHKWEAFFADSMTRTELNQQTFETKRQHPFRIYENGSQDEP